MFGRSPIQTLAEAANIRAFEADLALRTHLLRVPAYRWSAAQVARVQEGGSPTVLIHVGLAGWAWCTLGLLHLYVWARIRVALGREQKGYRCRIWVT